MGHPTTTSPTPVYPGVTFTRLRSLAIIGLALGSDETWKFMFGVATTLETLETDKPCLLEGDFDLALNNILIQF
jgi:hypothetical protein